MRDNKVVVIGLGYVGLPTAAIMANAGIEVHGVDVNPATLQVLNAGGCPIGEPEVVKLVTGALASGRLKASDTPVTSDVFIICVPTPITDEKRADVSIVRAATRTLAKYVKKGDLIILESTSPVGTTEHTVGEELAAQGFDIREDLDLCYCPERVFPGSTISEIVENDRIIGGLTPRAAARASALYARFCTGGLLETASATAEFSKLMENTYRDVNIALANVFGHIAEASGIDVNDAITLANRHPRVNVHKPGPGVGGHCIPVDPWFLIDGFPEQTGLLLQSRLINDGQPHHLWARVKRVSGAIGKVAILGAAYRGNLDDARDTPAEHLIHALKADGVGYAVHDPHVSKFRLHCGQEVPVNTDLAQTLDGADAAIIMTDHSAYRGLGPEAFAGMSGKLIADGRNLVDRCALSAAGFTVIPVGAPLSRPSGQAFLPGKEKDTVLASG
ncbi:UDP-N-acetyl-D-mannosamine dehydrogenase [Glycocaulis albus]|jgi:UDP-N-acetyl-D-mannosaminuronic acid dehydrogenase|uniref:UDP-N-acetyl-D-mannosamine dehydrogenase n=1 Tax=Glycocaulis albus TaxID=1382801 RepID=A0ABQ1XYX5_9PROT|nr:nucleotide sugar dehydrogenase [Glycocaulis albus]GGH06630.1 UDP-N-acetyl-D-mannosamine dehydrogenase [Glycocaulis albus]